MTYTRDEALIDTDREIHGWTMELACDRCGLRWFEWTEDGAFDEDCDCGGTVEER